ncbi:YbaB/EbfC family nucleoid-associated protein [Mycobacterium sp. AZCC_0083]|uniref:YbaB/EbfC family nucleoid-associated protein n=1 Tax=Mycobacterium sp. AZCC_0083 TaxID=2735882 RepID=UPI0016172CF9|nr:YbaB/EbfC family nucleoid-associated protein [Mycobacterium sp. AZCC_0083]MBB5167575.1 hypothetical protein [Mycobacterium sp. AZCC_0083]
MDNDALRHEVEDLGALVADQMRELAKFNEKRSALAAKAAVADGMVEVSVDAQHVLTGVVINDSYLNDFELADLADYITRAAQAAAHEVDRRSAALVMPVTQRRETITRLSAALVDVPEFGDILAGLSAFTGPPGESRSSDALDDPREPAVVYPIVKERTDD